MAKEVDDGLDFRAVGHLILDLIDHIKDAGLSMEEQTVGIGDMLLHLLVDAGNSHHRDVRTTIGHRVATGNDKRGHIVREGTTSLNQGETAGTGVGILDGTRREDDTIADLTVAGNLSAIAKHAVVAPFPMTVQPSLLVPRLMTTFSRITLLLPIFAYDLAPR